MGTIAPAAGVPGPPGLLLGWGGGLWPPSCGSAVGVGPAAQLLARTRESGPQVSGSVSAGRLGSPVPALGCTPSSPLLTSRARGDIPQPDIHPASALPALRVVQGAPGTPSFASTAPACAGSCDLWSVFA